MKPAFTPAIPASITLLVSSTTSFATSPTFSEKSLVVVFSWLSSFLALIAACELTYFAQMKRTFTSITSKTKMSIFYII